MLTHDAVRRVSNLLCVVAKYCVMFFVSAKELKERGSEPLFKGLEIHKLTDLVTLHNVLLMYHYHNDLLLSSFEIFFPTVAPVHSYNTSIGINTLHCKILIFLFW